MKFSETPRRKRNFVHPVAASFTAYDLSSFDKIIQAENKDVTDRNSPRWYCVRAIPAFCWKAIDNPGIVVARFFEEMECEHAYLYLYLADSMTLVTNYWLQGSFPRGTPEASHTDMILAELDKLL